MKPNSPPPLSLTLFVVISLTLLWGYLRLVLFADTVLPLTFVIPLLVCVWTRRRWQLYAMAAVFAVMGIVKGLWVLPPSMVQDWERIVYVCATVANLLVGAISVDLILNYRNRIEQRNALITEQNEELEEQAEELSQQNEEIRAQTEELAQQNEEIESQSEELQRQNDELVETNRRLYGREELLQGLLQSARTQETREKSLEDVCGRTLAVLGEPAEMAAVWTLEGELLKLQTQVPGGGEMALPSAWPLGRSIARVVLLENRTAYVADLREQPHLAEALAHLPDIRSLLVTPLQIDGRPAGVLMASSSRPSHWSDEQFRVLEWLAAQCGLIAQGLHWQRALVDRSRELEEANRSKDQFLAMLSHELRTPLTPVLAAAGALQKDPRLPVDVREDLEMMHRNVAIQSRLIDDLLDLTRIARGKLELSPHPLDPAALLRDTAAIVAADLDAKEQALTIQLDLPRGCNVNGDGPRLQQVFWNLLKNAIKFSPVRAPIIVSARVTSGLSPRLVVNVKDQGIGIGPHNLDRIFLPFEQVGERLPRNGDSGLGLGLSIAKSLVELHHGRITASSPGSGRGACFTVELPVMAAVAPMPATAVNGTVETEHAFRILLVEDHLDTSRVISRLLRNAGHTVECAGTATAALELCRKTSFDLLLSDLGLPDENGLVLIGKLRALRPQLPAICMSGYAMDEDLQACRDAGFHEHITKPVEMQQLFSAIRRAMFSPKPPGEFSAKT
jgi:signal transduction histidine kinase/CheY-like chemotaxis protein